MTVEQPDAGFFAVQSDLAGEYSFERELGRGGMGTVYLAREVALDRLVAIKVLHAELAEREEQRERFLREARTGAKLAHPNIVPIYAVGEAGGTVYIVMGFVDGEPVRSRLHREGPLGAAETARIVREVGQALGHAHAMGLLHRDVTLDNILLERHTGRALLADFGIAAEVEQAGSAPLVGTPAYLAPELIHGEPPSVRSDLYALGIAAWTMLTGRLPFPDDDPARVLIRQVSEPVPPLETAAAGTPGPIRRAVMHALAKAPEDRPADVESWLGEWSGGDRARALAAPLATWVDGWSRVRIFYALAFSTTAMLGMVSSSLSSPYFEEIGFLQLFRIAIFSLPPLLFLHAAINIRQVRMLAQEGYRIEDLRLALARARREGATTPRPHGGLFSRLIFDLTLLAGGVWCAWGILGYPDAGSYYAYVAMDGAVWRLAVQALRIGYLVFWTGLGFAMISPPFRLRPDGWMARLREWYWNSSIGRFHFRLASWMLGRDRGTPHTLHRPTELVLDLAIEDLWLALPEGQRGRMEEIPQVARRLRARIGALRDLAAKFESARMAPPDDLREREQSALAALEELRLGLMSLSGTTAPTGELTEALRGARSLEAELLVDLGADPRIAGRLAGISRRTDSPITPTPSPA